MRYLPLTPLDKKINSMIQRGISKYYDRDAVYDMLVEMSIWSADAVFTGHDATRSIRASAGIPTHLPKADEDKRLISAAVEEDDMYQ